MSPTRAYPPASRRPRRHAAAARPIAVGLIAAWAGLLAGCELFKPAIPEPPVTSGINTNYTTPEAVLETVADAVEAKSTLAGQTAYAGAFADSTVDGIPYYATFVPEVKRRYESSGRTAPTWNYGEENRFYPVLITLRSEPYLMTFTRDETMLNDDRGTDAATLYRRYQVYASGQDGSTLGYVALGLAELHLQRTPRGRWAIVRWVDQVDLTSDTFGADPYSLTLSARRLGI
jgi:hypothetical protein